MSKKMRHVNTEDLKVIDEIREDLKMFFRVCPRATILEISEAINTDNLATVRDLPLPNLKIISDLAKVQFYQMIYELDKEMTESN